MFNKTILWTNVSISSKKSKFFKKNCLFSLHPHYNFIDRVEIGNGGIRMEKKLKNQDLKYLSFEEMVERTIERHGLDIDVKTFLKLVDLINWYKHLYQEAGMRVFDRNNDLFKWMIQVTANYQVVTLCCFFIKNTNLRRN